jgi:ubiquinone/menaquinone biosynthesis C-methylase UbiE
MGSPGSSVELASEWREATPYERWYDSFLGRAYAASVHSAIRPWVEAARPRAVLDVGCGPGITAGSVTRPGISLVELDCNFQMARRAEYRLGAEGRKIAGVVGSCSSIPLRSESVDLVLCVNCLEFTSERDRSFRELRRVLRPGGTAIVGVMNAQSPWELTRRLKAPFLSEKRSYYKRGRFFRAEELRRELEEARFEVAEICVRVHFPPIGSPVSAFYGACERAMTRLAPSRGAVILARSLRS